MEPLDVGIITVKDEELAALLDCLKGYREVPPASAETRFYYRAQVPALEAGVHEVVCVKALQQGNVSVVSVVRDVLQRWQPRMLVLVGIGGGLGSEVEIGDVVVATQILYYELGRVAATGTVRRVEAYRPSARLLMAAESVRDSTWAQATRDGRPPLIPRDPIRHMAPLGSGEKVIADAAADEIAFLRSMNYKVGAVDMEAAGIANAAYEYSSALDLLVIRGISDRADRNKSDDYQRYAARSAAGFLVAVLGKLAAQTRGLTRCEDILPILAACPEGLPVQVLASVCGVSEESIFSHARELARKSQVRFDEGTKWATVVIADGIEPARPDLLVLLLDECLAFVASHGSDKEVLRLVPTIRQLAVASTARHPRTSARVFKAVEKLLKRLGDKRHVLELARLSIDATRRVSQRTREEVELEAQAIICGVSWVYQRTGRLKEAMDEAERSLELGQRIRYDRNTAFCHKCIGRLFRLEAEPLRGSLRTQFLVKSAASIHAAIDAFSHHPDFGPDHPEVGACQSLLARTLLVRGDLRGARAAAETAWTLITEPNDKDYLDLSIVTGEIEFASGERQRAVAYFDAVIGGPEPTDCERSEILARAYLARAHTRAQIGMTPEALVEDRKSVV